MKLLTSLKKGRGRKSKKMPRALGTMVRIRTTWITWLKNSTMTIMTTRTKEGKRSQRRQQWVTILRENRRTKKAATTMLQLEIKR